MDALSRCTLEMCFTFRPVTTVGLYRLLAKTRRTDIPDFKPGDTVRVHVRIKEGDKERLQAFEGVVISKSRGNHAQFHGPENELRPGGRAYFPDQLQSDR